MKRFLKNTFLISLVSCFVIIIVAIRYEYKIRQVPNSYKYKYEWMQRNAETVEILILGSSHTFYGIRPEFFEEKTFNLANVSQDLRHDLYLLDYWLERYKNMKIIICPISLFTWFSSGLESGKESYRCRYYKIYMDCDLYPDFSSYNLELSDSKSAKAKLNANDRDRGCDKYGWGSSYKLSSKNMARWNDGSEAASAVERHTVKDWEYVDYNYSLMKKIAQKCKNYGIQLVLITTPCWHIYYDNLNQTQLSKMYELTNRIINEYKLPYFDYLKDKRFEADDFFDSNHLSDIGAIKFTKILAEDIKHM